MQLQMFQSVLIQETTIYIHFFAIRKAFTTCNNLKIHKNIGQAQTCS